MAHLNWLHLSDWHQKGPEFDRTVIADKLIADIKSRGTDIDAGLTSIDFIVFSGDIANSGDERQFALAAEKLIDPVRDAIGREVPIYIVPGNHDIQRPLIRSIPPHIGSVLATENGQEIENLLQKNLTIGHFNEPLANFYDFATKQGCKYDFNNKLYFVSAVKKGDKQIGITCLNTAWHSARTNIRPRPKDKEHEFWDRGCFARGGTSQQRVEGTRCRGYQDRNHAPSAALARRARSGKSRANDRDATATLCLTAMNIGRI